MNLLPEQYKKDLQLEAWRRFLIFFGTYVSVVGVVALMLLMPSYFFLKFQIDTIQRQYQSLEAGENYKKTQEGQKEVRQVNRSLGAFISFENAKPKISVPLEELLSHSIPGISISAFSYNERADGVVQVQISGRATKRDIYLAFIDNLQQSPYVKEKISPVLSELLKETDINFLLNFPVVIK